MRNAELNEMSYLTRSPISLDALLAEVSSAACGGTCLFLGTVRNGPEEQGVTAIEYSAYEEMVEAEGRWPEARIAVRHRVGVIPTRWRTAMRASGQRPSASARRRPNSAST